MATIARHDVLILKSNDGEEPVEVEVVAIDEQRQLYTCYCAKEDWLAVYVIDGTKFAMVHFEPEKEPWQS